MSIPPAGRDRLPAYGPGAILRQALLLLFALWLLVPALLPAQPLASVPLLERRVTDLTGTLSAAQRDALEAKLAAFEARKGSQVVVLMVRSTRPEAIEQFSIRVAEAWKIGRSKVDDGVILLVARDDRALRIEVGRGLEGALPDITANRIINEVIVPRFRDGDFAGGIEAGVDRILGVIDGEPLPEPVQREGGGGGDGGVLEVLMVMVLVGAGLVGGILRTMVGKAPAAGIVGSGVGLLAWAVSGMLAAAIGAALIAAFLTLAGSGMPGGGGRRGGWGGGGGWSSGGGGGGWSGGGGGGFGGGGASGRW